MYIKSININFLRRYTHVNLISLQIKTSAVKWNMGALASRQHAGVEEADVVSNHAYKYPPRSGSYMTSINNSYFNGLLVVQ